MKTHNIIIPILFTCLSIGGTSLLYNKDVKEVKAATLPKTIYLRDNTDDEIRDYYSSLSSLSESELQGTNLLKNLKGIISNVSTYYTYSSNIPNIYVITERDWENSPAEEITTGTYNNSTQTLTNFKYANEVAENPYIKMLYCDYTVKNKTVYKGDGDVNASQKTFDNEHVWSQSHGFSDGTTAGSDLEGAGTDLHHLKAGTQYGNRILHSNYTYGFVKTNDSEWSEVVAANSKPYENKNKRGEPLFTHSQDQTPAAGAAKKVFEPQDCDKGDIARALLYMVACYNNLDGSTPTNSIPALWLQDYFVRENSTGFSSVDLANGYYGCLSDILAWHRMDPVDEFEIHRNNLIYNNYQHNRNPFIDYPQWVDYIWGVSEYTPSTRELDYDPAPTGSVNLDLDVINGYRNEIEKISIERLPNKRDYKVGEQLDKTGMIVIATLTDNSELDVTDECRVSPQTFTSEGEQTVTVSYKGKTATFTVNVAAEEKQEDKTEEKKEFPIKLVIIIGAIIVGVIVIILIFAGILKVNKKGKIKVNKSKVKKIVKGTNKKKK